MSSSEVINTTVAEVTAALLRQGLGSDELVTIIIEPAEGFALARRESRVRVAAAGLTDENIDRMIKRVRRVIEPL
jgi:hypothetical protein